MSQSDATSKISSILSEYKSLLEEKLHNERTLLLSDSQFLENVLRGRIMLQPILEVIQARGGLYGTDGITDFYIGRDLVDLYKAADEFWKDKGATILNLISKLEESAVTVISAPSMRELHHLPLYFDTVLVEDMFETTYCEKDDRISFQSTEEALHRWGVVLGDYLATYALINQSLEIATDKLVYIIYPSSYVEVSEGNENRREAAMDKAVEYTTSILNQKFQFPKFLTYDEIISNILELDSKMVEEILGVLIQEGEYHNTVKPGVDQEGITHRIKKNHPKTAFHKLMLNYVAHKSLRTNRALILENHAVNLNAVRGTSHFDWHASKDLMSLNQEVFRGDLGFSDEYAGLMALQYDGLKWLHNIPWNAMKALREQGQMEEMRSFFRTSNRRLINSPMEDFETICKTISAELSYRLDEEEKRITAEKAMYAKKFSLSVTSFSISMSLGLATAIFPALAPLSIPATVISGVVGASSATDIVKMQQNRSKSKKKNANRPVAILLAARDSHESTSY